jgi:hypothetical protein
MSQRIVGVLPVVHTPFLDDELIDHDSLRRQVDWAFELGAGGHVRGMLYLPKGSFSSYGSRTPRA